MRILTRFGTGSRVYTFPEDSQVTFTDNFASLVTKTVRVAGVNGGLSQLGSGRGLSPIGSVRADNWLEFYDFVQATDKLDSIRQMADWGLQPLFMQPLYGEERWCWARLNDQQLQQNVANVPHRQQKIPIVFEVPDPFWYTAGNEILWGAGHKWGAATSIWGGSASTDGTGATARTASCGRGPSNWIDATIGSGCCSSRNSRSATCHPMPAPMAKIADAMPPVLNLRVMLVLPIAIL